MFYGFFTPGYSVVQIFLRFYNATNVAKINTNKVSSINFFLKMVVYVFKLISAIASQEIIRKRI